MSGCTNNTSSKYPVVTRPRKILSRKSPVPGVSFNDPGVTGITLKSNNSSSKYPVLTRPRKVLSRKTPVPCASYNDPGVTGSVSFNTGINITEPRCVLSSKNPKSNRGVKRVSDVNDPPSLGKIRRLALSPYLQGFLNIRKVAQKEETLSTFLETVTHQVITSVAGSQSSTILLTRVRTSSSGGGPGPESLENKESRFLQDLCLIYRMSSLHLLI